MPIRTPVWVAEPHLGVCWALFRGHSAGTRPSSTAALINASKSVTPSEAVLMIRCAIFALVASVRCDWSMRSTAVFSADLMSITSSGLNFGVAAYAFRDPCEGLPIHCDEDASPR